MNANNSPAATNSVSDDVSADSLFGDVPSHWGTHRLANILSAVRQGWSPQCENRPADRGEWGVLKVGCMNSGFYDESENKILPPELEPRPELEVRVDDVLMSRSNTRELAGLIGRVDQTQGRILLCDKLYRLDFDTSRIDLRFAVNLLRTPPCRFQLERRATGASQSMKNISIDAVRDVVVPLPPFVEQERIVRFIDVAVGKIDTLVSKKRELIELLQEKRRALVSRCVTRGLPPDAARAAGLDPQPKLKPSGVPWLGEIPEHWQPTRLKHLSPNQTVGCVINPSSYFQDEGIPFLMGNNIREGRINIEHVRFVSAESNNGPLNKSMVHTGDIIVVRVGAPGVAVVVPEELNGCNVASMMIVRRSDRFCSQWMEYAFNSQMLRDQVDVVKYGAAQKQFNISHAIDFWFATPPKEEQILIVEFLTKSLATIEALAEKVVLAIDHLLEYRSALITAAVTGKIDVREVEV